MTVNLKAPQIRDSTGDAGMTRTSDPQFRKPRYSKKIYRSFTTYRSDITKVLCYSNASFTCLSFTQIYLDFLGFTGLAGEKLGKKPIENIGQNSSSIDQFSSLVPNTIGQISRKVNNDQISSATVPWAMPGDSGFKIRGSKGTEKGKWRLSESQPARPINQISSIHLSNHHGGGFSGGTNYGDYIKLG